MIDGVLAAGQAMAEERMVDTCLIEHPGVGKGPLDRATNKHLPPPGTRVYLGRCEFQRPGTGRQVEAGEGTTTLEAPVVKVPVSVTGVDVGDVVTVLASRDPALVGRTFHVQVDPGKTYATARRLVCTEVTSS